MGIEILLAMSMLEQVPPMIAKIDPISITTSKPDILASVGVVGCWRSQSSHGGTESRKYEKSLFVLSDHFGRNLDRRTDKCGRYQAASNGGRSKRVWQGFRHACRELRLCDSWDESFDEGVMF